MVNQIIHGDCIEGMKKIESGSVDLVFADPPYNIGGKTQAFESTREDGSLFNTIREDWDTIDDFEKFNMAWLEQAYRILREGGSILCWGTRHNIYLCGYQIEALGFNIRTHYTWYKRNAMPCLTGRNPSESTEQLIWATKGNKWTYNLEYAKAMNGGQNIRDVIFSTLTPEEEKSGGYHPSQKRGQGLTDVLINLHSNSGDLVVVPFCGSGTEVVEADRHGRMFIAYELNKKYIDIAHKRLNNLQMIMNF